MDKKKQGTLGIWDGWSLGTGAMMGASIFVVSGTASGVAGPSAALGFLLAAMIAMIVALCNSEIATAFPETGGAYVYPRRVIPGIPVKCYPLPAGGLFLAVRESDLPSLR